MNEDQIISNLIFKCKHSHNYIYHNDVFRESYGEILALLEKKQLDNNLKKGLLVELYRYLIYENVPISIDPRGDWNSKFNVLYDIKEGLKNNNLDNNILEKIREENNKREHYANNPTKLIEELIEFNKKYPGAKF